MDKRKGIMAAVKQWGPTTRLFLSLAVIGIILTVVFGIPSCKQKNLIPRLSINLESHYLELYPESEISILPYKLTNKGDGTAYNIKKGHMVFDLLNNDIRSCKKFYEPEDKNDVLIPDESSAGHKDHIGVLEHNKSYKVQLVITYSSSKTGKNKKFYSLANYEIQSDNRHDKLFKIFQKSLDRGAAEERKIKDLINNCTEIVGIL